MFGEYDVVFIKGFGYVILFICEVLCVGWEMIVVVGGDGIFNEVVNGFFECFEFKDYY